MDVNSEVKFLSYYIEELILQNSNLMKDNINLKANVRLLKELTQEMSNNLNEVIRNCEILQYEKDELEKDLKEKNNK